MGFDWWSACLVLGPALGPPGRGQRPQTQMPVTHFAFSLKQGEFDFGVRLAARGLGGTPGEGSDPRRT